MARRVLVRIACSLVLLLLVMDAAHAQMAMHHRPYPRAIEQGCALCRGTGNCSQAVQVSVGNTTAGVYCGDLVTTFQPCCCQYRNECMTTIFSEQCDCLTDAEVEQFMSARFTVFCIFTLLFWMVLIWDRMCGRPYKVMNSNRHHALANSPSVARLVDGAPPRETARDQELLEVDHSRSDADADDAAIEAALNAQADESPRSHEPSTNDQGTVMLNMQDDDASSDREEEAESTRQARGAIESV